MANQTAQWEKMAALSYLALQVGDTRKLGKKAVQKFIYLLQEAAGVPLGYSFRFYTYGPFSEQLAGDLDIADRYHAVDIQYDYVNNAYSIVRDEKSEYFVDKARGFINDYRAKIDRVISDFKGRTALDLELVATIIFLLNDFKSDGIPHAELIEMTKKLKPRFSDKKIESMIKELAEKKYLAVK